jgi:phage terminase large subunit
VTVPLPSWQIAWLKSRDNPLIFVREVLGTEPEAWQAEALEAIARNDRVSIRSGHGVGKTTLFAWLVLWFLLTRQDCKIPIAANSQDQLRDTVWPEIAKWHRKLPEALKGQIDVQAERVVVKADPEGSFAVRRTASKDNPEALQGFHAKNLLFLVDEASGIPDVVFEVGAGALSTEGAKAVLAGNPTRASGFFHDTHHRLRDRWTTLRVNSEDVPRARGHISDIIARYGKDSNAYRVRVLGEFPTADDEAVIPLETVEAAISRQVFDLGYMPVWGLDVARFGDDRTALAKRVSNKLLEPIKSWHGQDLMQTVGRLQAEYIATPPPQRPYEILIDSVGLGSGVLDRAREIGLPVRGVNVGEAAAVKEHYQRLRDELWFRGRDWFAGKDVSIPADQELIAELTAPLYTFSSTGKIVVESKDEMKKRGLRSPDLADAFLLTFAAGLPQRYEEDDPDYDYDGHRGRSSVTGY